MQSPIRCSSVVSREAPDAHSSALSRIAVRRYRYTPCSQERRLIAHPAGPAAGRWPQRGGGRRGRRFLARDPGGVRHRSRRSEEHTSELQSHSDLVCRLLLEKKKKKNNSIQLP